jgi:hypothetical protein
MVSLYAVLQLGFDNHHTMHSCLAIYDLLHTILFFAYDGKDDVDDRGLGYASIPNTRAVFYSSLALVCRAWHEAAVNLLWSSQHSILPLLKLFPRDLWEITQQSDVHAVCETHLLLACPCASHFISSGRNLQI